MLPAAASVSASGDPAALCEAAALRAAARHDVPVPVMLAVARVESGRAGADGRVRPWPWAVNTGAQGHWPPTPDAALALARATQARGRDSFDLGCFQINHRWHGSRFASLEAMLHPQTNADYAARLLARLKGRHGSWRAAVGAYHSATPALAVRYLARFDRALAAQSVEAADPARVEAIRQAAQRPEGPRLLMALQDLPAAPGSVLGAARSEARPVAAAPAAAGQGPVSMGGLALGVFR